MVLNRIRQISIVFGVVAVALPSTALAEMRSSPISTRQTTVLAAQPASGSIVEQLQLTDQQKQKIRAIRKARSQSIAKVLNPAQRTKLGQSLRSGTKLSAALQTLGLSADQKKQIGTIARKSNQDIAAALTPKQRQQLATYLKQHQTTAQSPIE